MYIAKQTNEADKYKIGCTVDLNRRIKEFSTGNSYIELMASVRLSDYKGLEKFIQGKYVLNNFKNEWFTFDSSTYQEIINDFSFNMHIGGNDE